MTRYIATPLPFPFEPIPLRRGGFDQALLPAIVSAAGTESARAALADPNVLLVTTGQQPSLFLGPLYTVHKALSAALLARRLTTRWKRPVVPIFWVAGDDHDFAEAATASWLNSGGELVTRVLRHRDPAALQLPMYREALGSEVTSALDALTQDLPPSEYREATLAWLGRHFTVDATMAAAYAGALAEMLGPHGVLCFDSSHPVVKQLAAPVLLKALRGHRELTTALAATDAQLKSGGHEAGIAVGDNATLVMVEGRLGRDRLIADGAGFTARRSGEKFTIADLELMARDEPMRLSPNVLLRPVLESALLPTVAYVAGPGELRYLRLTPPIYRLLGVHRQVPVPRWSGLVVETRVDRALEKFGATIEELLAPPPGLEARVLRSQLPVAATDALTQLAAAGEKAFTALAAAAHDIDPTLDRPVQNAKTQVLSASADLEKKLIQHLRKRGETELSQVVRSRTALQPAGKPQERLLGIAPFLSRYGDGFLGELSGAMEPWVEQALEGAAPPA